jgi:hypothetical protein
MTAHSWVQLGLLDQLDQLARKVLQDQLGLLEQLVLPGLLVEQLEQLGLLVLLARLVGLLELLELLAQMEQMEQLEPRALEQ